MGYLIKKNFVSDEENGYAGSAEIRNLLRLESDDPEEDAAILEAINWVEENSDCNVKGSKELIDLYNSIDNEKMDLTLPLSEIEFVGFFHDDEIILNLDGFNARGIYKFTDSFLDSLFSLKKFGRFCLANGEKDMLNDNINHLMTTQKDETRQFRFLMDGEELFLRGLTTTSYKYYDNNIAIYLALNALHRYSESNGAHIFVESGYITDSSLDMLFVQEERIKIDEDTFVEVGVRLSNNEITDGKLAMEFIYSIFDSKQNQFRAIGDTVVGIIHTYKVPTIQDKLDNLSHLSKYMEETVQHISSIKNRKRLDRDQLSLIFSRLSRAKKNELSKSSKKSIDHLYREEVIGNTYSLVELFGKIGSLGTTIEEKLFIQIVFNELITEGL